MQADDTADLHLLLCPPLPEEPAWIVRARRIIEAAIRPRMPQYMEAIGLRRASAQLRQDLVQAVLMCLLTDKVPPERHSDRRKKLLHVSKQAAAAAKIIRHIDSGLKETTPIPPGLHKFIELGNQAPEFAHLASVADRHAKTLTADKGGARGMVGFGMFVKYLARAFEHAAGRPAKVTWNQHDDVFEGRFVNLVEALLPVMLALSPNLPHPHSPRTRGKYIYDATRSPRQARGARKVGKKRIIRPRLSI